MKCYYHEGEFSLEFNSFLVLLKQTEEGKLGTNSLQLQSTLEIVDNIRQNLVNTMNEILRNFEKLNINSNDKRTDEGGYQKLKNFLTAGYQFMKSLTAREKP
jgi:hypothetical protein